MKKSLAIIFTLSFYISNASVIQYFTPEGLDTHTPITSYFVSNELLVEYTYSISNRNLLITKREDFDGLILTTVDVYKGDKDHIYLHSTLDDFGSTTILNPSQLVLTNPDTNLVITRGVSHVQHMSVRSGDFVVKGKIYDDCLIVEFINYYQNTKTSTEVFVYAKGVGLINYSFLDDKENLKYYFYLEKQIRG
ncbi:MAG: hypothetical protein JXR63_08465 [Spirochaetales bacterium]|nr:hypothetical protein [Spirochaetales bacterium]